MLDLSLFSHPTVVAGIIMAVVTSAALAGVELTLAQERQYVLGKTPLEASFFMVPIMVAATFGGPVAGHVSNVFSRRLVATAFLLVGAASLAYLASDRRPLAQYRPDSSRSPSLGSLPREKGSAVGSLEATCYELGAGLGITIFGVALATNFTRATELPQNLAAPLAEQASPSIGDVYLVAKQLG